MVKLISIRIKGFKERDREVFLEFSKEPVTVIYGVNGSGKTTLLKLIYAIFNKDDSILIEENVQEIELFYQKKTDEIKRRVFIKVNEKKVKKGGIEHEVKWSNEVNELNECSSILFGIDRGVITKKHALDKRALHYLDEVEMLHHIMRKERLEKSTEYDERFLAKMDWLLRKISRINMRSNHKGISKMDWSHSNHIFIDSISIGMIKDAIIRQYQRGQRIISEQVKNAFFNTISNAVDIEMEQQTYDLPDDFDSRIEQKRDDLINLIKNLDTSSLQKKLLDFLQTGQKKEIEKSKIFRAMLVNILNKVEDENINLKSISRLIEIFNNHLYRSKEMIVTEEKAYIAFTSGERHSLEKLSSGERHLLTFLTLFLIMGRGRNFFIIDEPEISLNMKWQRELMPLLSEINPQAQIIVATHSPAIAHKNTNYLVELK